MRLVRTLLVLVSLVTAASAVAHQGGLNQIPWVACEDKSLNDDCHFYNSKEDVFRGSCQSMNEVLICVRNQPIEYATDNAQIKADHHDEELAPEAEDVHQDGHSH